MNHFTRTRFKKLAGLLNEQVSRKSKSLLSWVYDQFNDPEQFIHSLEDLLSRDEMRQIKQRFEARWGYEADLDESKHLDEQARGGGRASQMMSKIIKTAGPEDFSQEFVDRMGPDMEDDIRAILSYVARRLDVEV